jgi:hypothetical protein
MDRDSAAVRTASQISGSTLGRPRASAGCRLREVMAAIAVLFCGCSHVGRLENVEHTVSPAPADSTERVEGEQRRPLSPWRPLFGDTLIGLEPGTADSSIRLLGRLRDGFTADTLNILLTGDNRPGYRVSRLRHEFHTIRDGLSLNPIKIVKGLITIPWALAKGLFPDLMLIRELPSIIKKSPNWSFEHQVVGAMVALVDSVEARGQVVAAVVSTGDLVFDGRRPTHWERFLRITEPLTTRVPYFPVAGGHERTDTEDGVENWRIATGLPVGGDRLYYCFDSADGWVRFIMIDSNAIVDPNARWPREAQVAYSEEQFTWLVDRVKEHRGPVLVAMHNPPFSVGIHRSEWQRDPVLVERRERMMRALKESGISILATGHEHSYQRALITWPDAVLVVISPGGGGAPLQPIPPPAESARLFAEYKVAGSEVKPENVFTSQVFCFTHLRLWFGGGDFYSYAVDEDAKTTLMDKVEIDLQRYGIPQIDQFKRPIAPSEGPTDEENPDAEADSSDGEPDSIAAGEKLLTEPPPSGVPEPPTPAKK